MSGSCVLFGNVMDVNRHLGPFHGYALHRRTITT